jgi:hypothetical protein
MKLKLKAGIMLGRCRAGTTNRINPITGFEEENDERMK